MLPSLLRKTVICLGFALVVWIGVKFLLPVLLPFLLGGLLAMSAEPMVQFGVNRLRLPRPLSAAAGVTMTLFLLAGILMILGALAVKELGVLAGALPDIRQTVHRGLVTTKEWMVTLASRTPEGVRPVLTNTVQTLFGNETLLLDQAAEKLPNLFTSAIGRISGGVLWIGTGILAGFMISSRLPRLRQMIKERTPKIWKEQYLPALRRVRQALGGWLRAQVKLSALTYGIVAVGFLLLRIPYGFLWAIPVALVDAVPILGTGTVLLPWALVELLQGQQLRAVGLLCTYGVALITRTVMEPRLVGKQIGLDPLATLLFLYTGYRFWGILGMLAAPVLAAAVKSFSDAV